jgi:ribonuclease, rne/rng family
MLEIFIDKQEKQEKVALVENGNLVEYYEEDENTDRKEGNIYVGTVKDIIPGMQSAFVDIGTEKNGFIHLKDILPKIDERKESLEPNIEIGKVIKPNQKLLVQIKKDSNDKKGARVSTHINLPGKYIVLMPNTSFITVSQKIEDKAEQERLINLVKKYIGKENGAIIRTSAVKKEKELIHDIEDLERKWKKIREKYEQVVKQNNKESLIYEAENILEKMIIDLSNEKIENIVTNDEKKYAQLLDEKSKSDELVNTKIILENKDVLDIYDIKKQLEKLPNRKIWLKCGGFITIDKTEALTAIDVNTGKYTGNRNLEQTLYKVNEEATVEIAKQLRLRDIGGIIIIDYIDMKKQENKDKIQKLLEQRLKFDRAKTQVEGFTKLDLMEMTRKHICSHKDRKENI